MRKLGFLHKYIKAINRSLFLKIFLSYTIVFVIMIVMVGTYTRFYVLKNLDNEIERFEIKKINETLNILDVMFGEMQKLTLNHAINANLLQFAYIPRSMLVEKRAEVKEVQELLTNSINSSNYIHSMSVFYESNGYMLDYSGLIDLSSFYDRAWYDGYSQMTGTTAILDTRKVANRASSEGYGYSNIITFITKIPYSNEPRAGAVILNVDEKMISNLLKNITQGDGKALACLVNRDGTILSSSREDYLYRNISEIIPTPQGYLEPESGSFPFTSDHTKMRSYYDSFGLNSWRLFYIVSENTIIEKSTAIQNITVIILSALLLLATTVSLLFSFRLYDPIKRIIYSIKKMSASEESDLSDVSMIGQELKMLVDNNRLLESQLIENKIFLRETFLSHLISGKLFSRAEILNRADYFSIRLDYKFFKVAVLQAGHSALNEMEIPEIEFKKVTLVNMVENVFSNLHISVDCARDLDDNIIILLKLSEANDINVTEAEIEHTFEDIQNSILKFLDLSISIGIGKMKDDLSGIGTSFKEATEALRYKSLKADAPVISYTEIAGSHTDILHYPVEMEQKLITLINLRDSDKVRIILDEMINLILDGNKNFQHIEVCLSNITGIIQRCVYELNINMKDIFDENEPLNISLNEFTSIRHYREWIGQKFQKIIDYNIDQQKGHSASLITDIKKYVEEKYMEEISLVTVSDYFKYNPSYFCKTFKDKTGTSFWEYVSKIRVEKSKALLLGTDHSIEQIAGMVGYNNRFSYIRTFKKYFAVTPGEYRIKHSPR